MGLFDSAFKKIEEETGVGGDWKDALARGFTGPSKKQVGSFYSAVHGGSDDRKRFAKTATGEFLQSGVAGAGIGIGAFSHLFGKKDAPNTPVSGEPAVGATTRSAMQQARQRAIDAARRRFGISDTVTTSPLGLTGQGAQLGKKRLIGE